MASIEDFKAWIEQLSRFGRTVDTVEIAEPGSGDDGEVRYKVHIYTDTNCYSISAREPMMRTHPKHPSDLPRGENDPIESPVQRMDNGYLGCISNSRKPRAGEDWTRGNDLANGPLTEETWHRILTDIVSYEMVGVHQPDAPIADRP